MVKALNNIYFTAFTLGGSGSRVLLEAASDRCWWFLCLLMYHFLGLPDYFLDSMVS